MKLFQVLANWEMILRKNPKDVIWVGEGILAQIKKTHYYTDEEIKAALKETKRVMKLFDKLFANLRPLQDQTDKNINKQKQWLTESKIYR